MFHRRADVMTKRKYVVLIVILVLALALTAFCLWYTRPDRKSVV